MKLSEKEKIDKLRISELYGKILTSVMEFILSRYRKDPDYGWVDTKRSLITGFDYPDEDRFKGKSTVYGWIQGRALEAITCHARWFEENGIRPDLTDGLKEILRKVLAHLEYARQINGGHLFFFMDPGGRAFSTDSSKRVEYLPTGSIEVYNYSDLFCSKGMLAAASYLGLAAAEKEARQYCMEVSDALWQGNFASDQYSFRGRINSSGRILNSIGPYMLLLDTAEMLSEKDPEYAGKFAVRLIERLLNNHINLDGKWGFGEPCDCIESVNVEGRPLVINGIAESDPGHCIEFTGLALRFIQNQLVGGGDTKTNRALYNRKALLTEILERNFANGYVEKGGICKGYDLITESIIDDDMPWWSLPETMRASLYAYVLSDDAQQKQRLLNIYKLCHRAFESNYLRPELDYMSVQTIGADGMVKDTIPATPDADPGYHTGICLIDCLRVMKNMDMDNEQ